MIPNRKPTSRTRGFDTRGEIKSPAISRAKKNKDAAPPAEAAQTCHRQQQRQEEIEKHFVTQAPGDGVHRAKPKNTRHEQQVFRYVSGLLCDGSMKLEIIIVGESPQRHVHQKDAQESRVKSLHPPAHEPSVVESRSNHCTVDQVSAHHEKQVHPGVAHLPQEIGHAEKR